MFLLIPCDWQQSTDHSLRNAGLYFVPFLWCYILVVEISGGCNPFQNCALKAADCCVCLKELKPLVHCCTYTFCHSFSLYPKIKLCVWCVCEAAWLNKWFASWLESGFQFLKGTNQSTESGWPSITCNLHVLCDVSQKPQVHSPADQALHVSFTCYATCH